MESFATRAVNVCYKALYLRCLRGSWLHLWRWSSRGNITFQFWKMFRNTSAMESGFGNTTGVPYSFTINGPQHRPLSDPRQFYNTHYFRPRLQSCHFYYDCTFRQTQVPWYRTRSTLWYFRMIFILLFETFPKNSCNRVTQFISRDLSKHLTNVRFKEEDWVL